MINLAAYEILTNIQLRQLFIAALNNFCIQLNLTTPYFQLVTCLTTDVSFPLQNIDFHKGCPCGNANKLTNY